MDFNWAWKAVLIIVTGTILLRISGRRSISQMTVSQTVLMISIGNLLIQPVSERNIWITFATAAVIILTLLLIEFLQIKFNLLERWITGEATLVINNGKIIEKNLKRTKLTVDKLEMRLRQESISSISDVKTATIEPSGQIGFLLMENKQPATKEDIQNLTNLIYSLFPQASQITPPPKSDSSTSNDIFQEVVIKEKIPEPPKRLH